MRAKSYRWVLATIALTVGAGDLAVALPAQAGLPVGRESLVVNAAPVTEVLAPAGPTTSPVVIRGQATDDRAITKVKLTVKDRDSGRYWNPATGRWQAAWLWFDTTIARPRARSTEWSFTFDPTGTPGSGRYRATAVAWDDQGRRDPGTARSRFRIEAPVEDPPVDEDPGPGPGTAALVWHDEFDGPTLDLTRWKTFSGLYNTPYCVQDYTARSDNVRVENGHLVLEAHPEASNGQDYTSGMVVSNDVREAASSSTRGNTAWRYGRFEMRARVPDAPGLWPAFWMRPADGVYGGWPRSGEIDILEYAGPTPTSWSDRRIVHDLHWWSDTARNNNGSYGQATPVTAAWLDEFHTFAVEWGPTGFRWYVDGRLSHEATGGWSAPGAPAPAPFDQDFFITLNLQVGGWAGPVADQQLPGAFEIDWVRVYQ